MRRTIISLVAIFFFGAGPTARTADDVKTILGKAIKAHGGEEMLTKYKAARTNSKGKLKLPGVGDVEFTQEVAAMLPDKFKESLELDVANMKINVTTIGNGDKFSINANGTDVPITDNIKKAMKDARYMAKVARFWTLLKDKEYELSVVGEAQVEGKPAIGIHVARKGERDINLFFSKETGLLVKLEHRTVDPTTEKEFAEERIILEYSKKDKDGLPYPKKVLIRRDGEQFMEAEILEVKHLESIDDGEFKK